MNKVIPARRRLQSQELTEVYQTLKKTFGHQGWWPGRTPFEVIVGAILTQNTAWTNVEKAIENLRRAGKLSPAAMRRLSPRQLAGLIRPAGYFNVKAKRLHAFLSFLFTDYGGSLKRMFRTPGPKLRRELLAVNGIGPETADSILLYAAGKRFFVIDAYTKRVFSRHRLHSFESGYEVWQALFQGALPASTALYNDYHAQIVRVGKDYCRPRPVCEQCPLKGYL